MMIKVLDRSSVPSLGGDGVSYKLWPAAGHGVSARLSNGEVISSDAEIEYLEIAPRLCGDFYAEALARNGRYVAGTGFSPKAAFEAAVSKLN
jgi:hypothetical protein